MAISDPAKIRFHVVFAIIGILHTLILFPAFMQICGSLYTAYSHIPFYAELAVLCTGSIGRM